MIKNLRKLTTWLLGALASVALILGIVLSTPQVKMASAADTAVTINAASAEGHDNEKNGYLQLRMDTAGQTWTNSQNNKTLSELPSSVTDYTTINGKTLNEWQTECTGDLPIIVTLQPAGSFSFIRVWIPSEFLKQENVASMGVLDGWAFNDGNANYTSPAVTFLRTTGAFVNSNTITDEKANVSISDARIQNRLDANKGRGADSYIVDIDIGKSGGGEYDAMYNGYLAVRNAIKINGKSIDEWNTQLIAEEPSLNEPSTYTVFPQNSTDPGHKSWFVKPIGLWGTSTGFRLTILQAVAATWETIEITIDETCWLPGSFIVEEKVSKVVWQQKVVDVTDWLTFLDNSHNAPADWGETNLYYIHTNGRVAWTKAAPLGGCLNELDPTDGGGTGGGQIQMKYIYFNGTSLYDINRNDNGTYGSTQGNIVNGSLYAPIFASMSAESGASLKLAVPTAFTNGKTDHEEIIIKKGFAVYENGTSYVVTKDVVFTSDGVENPNGTQNWVNAADKPEVDEPTTQETAVTAIITKARTGSPKNFIAFQLSNCDYASVAADTAVADVSSLVGFIDIGGTVLSSTPEEPLFNWSASTEKNTLAFRAPGLDASQLRSVAYITIKAGAKFPAYSSQNGGKVVYYVTTEDITFDHDSSGKDIWTKREAIVEYTVNFTVEGAAYGTPQTVQEGGVAMEPTAPTKAEDANYTYTFKQWTLNGAAYDFSTPVTANITLVAEFTATPKVVDVDITSELGLAYQGVLKKGDGSLVYPEGRVTYLIKTTNNYWTKAPENVDALAQKLWVNGNSVYNININNKDTIKISVGTDGGKYSYIQLHILADYPTAGATVNENYKNIWVRKDFVITENYKNYKVTSNVEWVNLNGEWVDASKTTFFEASAVTIGNPRIGGDKGELYMVDIVSNAWTITCNQFDFMYNSFAEYRKDIYINGVSVYDINKNTDDSKYTYSTFPMKGADDATFAHPVLIKSYYQEGAGEQHTITLWMHKDYIESLDGEITVTLGAGYSAYTSGARLRENVDYSMTATVQVDNGVTSYSVKVIKGTPLSALDYAYFRNFDGTWFKFAGWLDTSTGEILDMATLIVSNLSLEEYSEEYGGTLIETEVIGAVHYLKTDRNDSWMVFGLSANDYLTETATASIWANAKEAYDFLKDIGFLENIIVRGSINIHKIVSEATLYDIYDAHGAIETPYFNIWGDMGTFAIRVPNSDVESIEIIEGCPFPSASGDALYIAKGATYTFNETTRIFEKDEPETIDITMADGAAVRLTSNTETSGIRFEVKISKADVAKLYNQKQQGRYNDIKFGVIIAPTDYLVGGIFDLAWLKANYSCIDIIYTLDDLYPNGPDGYHNFPKEDEKYFSYFGSIVKLKDTNLNRNFSAIGYIYLSGRGEEKYVYADYNSANSRSAAFVANAAINDRNDDQTDFYTQYTENNNYSPYTKGQRDRLADFYITWGESILNAQDLTNLANKGGEQTVNIGKKLVGPYVELLYSTNVNVWGVFTYTDGSKTANEDFYLQAGSTKHRQFLDLFRYNGVGYGMNASNLTMVSVKFTNAELANSNAPAGEVKVIALHSNNKTIDTINQEIYLTANQADGSNVTVGAHLGLGGALTYLAKSGIYEGVIGGANDADAGYVAIRTSTSEFGATNMYRDGYNTTATEAGSYGHATSSLPKDGAVNLINNFDAGRQIQQSWYAQVGKYEIVQKVDEDDKPVVDKEGNPVMVKKYTGDEANGYQRAYCFTGSTEGEYWPYNPVQAGDVVSNPSQIIDYEIRSSYIYIKARAMDWAKGYDANRVCDNAEEGGVTTKSYMENYYRFDENGTLIVDNTFVDWNGFTDLENTDWASIELPAVYPVHTLNHYVSNMDGDGVWADGATGLEVRNDLESWTNGRALIQIVNPGEPTHGRKLEEWFAWANGGDANSFGMGMYIPNVNRFTSGRSIASTNYYTDSNFQNANAKPVKEYGYQGLFNKENKVSDAAERGNILAYKGLMSNMQEIKYTYQSAYVQNTSYTAPGVEVRMESYKTIEYSYAICLGTIGDIRATFKDLKDSNRITNMGKGYERAGLDAWARADKPWTDLF